MNQTLSERKDFYRYKCSKESYRKTQLRLLQLEGLGMVEIGVAQFGVPGISSGFYIENVWSYSDEYWNEVIAYEIDLIKRHNPNFQVKDLSIPLTKLELFSQYIRNKIDCRLPFEYNCSTRNVKFIDFKTYCSWYLPV